MNKTISHDEAVMNVIEQIYASQSIPESHKQSYVDSIKKDGFSDKMLDELETHFQKDAQLQEQDIQSDQVLLNEIQKNLEEEREKTDEEQAMILFSVAEAQKKMSQELAQEMEQTELDIERSFENVGKKSESLQLDAIRAKLLKK